MHVSRLKDINRRIFLQRTGQLAILGSASSFSLGLAGLGEASASTSTNDYKALVCVFLYGGNDHANTILPSDAENYAKYRSERGSIALEREELLNTVLTLPDELKVTDDIKYSLNPALSRMAKKFHDGNLAPVLNVGPLAAPLTKAEFEHPNNSSFPRPSKLFSHNDQQSTWQSFSPEGKKSGWGGRIADLAQSANQNAVFTSINATGNAIFMSGDVTVPFKVGFSGAKRAFGLTNLYGSKAAGDAMRKILGTHHSHAFEQDYCTMTERSLKYGSLINDAFHSKRINTQFNQKNSLAKQLEVVARMIAGREQLGVSRQVFMVSLGGFDHHANLLKRHESCLTQLDEALSAFYSATVELGVSSQVTTFTASDFGRTLTSNGDGSDHGWGGHHFVLGGAVRGGTLYGRAPHISTKSDDQVGRGRLLPTTSVDELSSTLGLWMGVSSSDLSRIAPNIGRFSQPNLGFMKM